MSDHYQLKKIILIDSFWPGKTVLLKLDGHTNLGGTNGAGKTTFLRLMQLFWGERPSNIVSGSGSKKGFLDYYLPRASSYLVYEYQRPYGQVCHVMVQSDGRGAKYKFIDAPYDQEYYIAENGFPRDSQSVERLYRSTAEISKFVAVDDYCSIIQCHRVSSGKKWLRPLQQRFAMGSAPLTHIEKVIGSVIEKIGDFDVIKQMLIDISRNKLSHTFLQQEDEQQPFQLNKQHIDAWLADLTAAREIEAKRDYFDDLLGTITALKETLKTLSHLHFLTLDQYKHCQQLDKTLTQTLKDLAQQREQLQQQYDRDLEPKNDELIKYKEQFNELKYQIESLEEQKLAYEQQDAESFAFEASLADEYAERQRNIQEEIDALESKTQEIKRHYEQRLNELKHRHDSQLKTYQQQLTEAKFEQEKNLRECEAEFQQRKERLQQDKDDRITPLNEQKTRLSTEFEVTKNRLQHPQIPEALTEQQCKNRQALDEAGRETKSAYQAQADAQNDHQNALGNYQQIERQLQQKKTERIQVQQRHEQCLKRLSPDPGSLQHYLDQEAEGWQQTIGRVIAPDLLDHTELEPHWSDGANKDFYGLGINLDKLAERSYLTSDKLKLEQQEKALFEQLDDLATECEKLEASLHAANKLREHAKAAMDKEKQRLERAKKLEQTLQDEADALADQIKVETEKARQRIRQDSERLSAEIATCQHTIDRISGEHREALQNLQNELLARKGIIESDGDNLAATISEQIAADKAHFKQEQTRISQQLKSDLQSSGADDTIVKLAEQRDEAKRLERQARSFQQKDREYRDWLKKRWNQHPGLCRDRDTCQSKIQHVETEISQLKQDFKRHRLQLNQQIGIQEEQLKKNRSLSNQLENCLEQLKNNPPVREEGQPHYAPGTLPQLSQDSIKERKRHEQVIHSGKQTLVQLFLKHHRSQLAEAWQQALDASSQQSPFFQAEALEIEQPLRDILQMIEHVKQATAQQIELHASGVNTFYQHLHNFDRAIKATGTELSKYVSEERYFAALGDITVNVRSKMSDLEYWQALKKFGDHYGQYRDNADLGLHDDIPEALVQAMGELTALLPSAGVKIKHLSLFDIEFSIHENGQLKHARNARELKDVSSTGLSYLALITFFTGVTSMLRKQNPTVVCWPIDELGDLAPENIEAMMQLLEKQNIHILSATPTADRHVLGLFRRRYLLSQQKLHEVELPQSKLEQLLTALPKQEDAHV
ncbi:ATP-binding protein [Methylomarinum vadi]|uniref:ATP-binding protein n=1 Tax=Methylomarinum vadi TaxID=438855 RepID=UPI0004DEDAE1|nr:ATP-binding protein [Methylomarinum vadi]